MSKISSFELAKEISATTQRPKGQGDGWTLDQHLIEHQRMATGVTINDTPKILVVSHDTPGRTKFWVALGFLIVAIAGTWYMGWVPRLSEFGVVQIAVAFSVLSLLVATIYASFSHTRMGINNIGLIARPWPPVPGIGVAVPLKEIRRFKVNKLSTRESTNYELLVITNDGKEQLIVPNIPLKRDAYLIAMLLIDRVKKLRGGVGNR